jgi:hypothetical protein
MPCLASPFLMDSYTLGSPMLVAFDFIGDSCRQSFQRWDDNAFKKDNICIVVVING